jgi:hypothetical protein
MKRLLADITSGRVDLVVVYKVALPSHLSGRAADNWEPLLVLAELAGGDWPLRARAALAALTGSEAAAREPSRNERLLADLREYHRTIVRERWQRRCDARARLPPPLHAEFEAALPPAGLISTSGFRGWLERSGVESFWATADKGKAATAEAIARALRAFGVRPGRHQTKQGGVVITTRGYFVAAISPLWRVHCPRSAEDK